MVKMTRYQWLLIVLLSANFGVVFLRSQYDQLPGVLHPEGSRPHQRAAGRYRRGVLLRLGHCRPVHGRVGGRIRQRKLILVVATLAFSLASVVSGFAASFIALLGARLLMGIAEGGIMPITQTLIASDVPHERRGLAQGLTQNFGANLLANWLGPLVIVWMGAHYGWRNAFFLSAIPGVIMAMLILASCVNRKVETVRSNPSRAPSSACCRPQHAAVHIDLHAAGGLPAGVPDLHAALPASRCAASASSR